MVIITISTITYGVLMISYMKQIQDTITEQLLLIPILSHMSLAMS